MYEDAKARGRRAPLHVPSIESLDHLLLVLEHMGVTMAGMTNDQDH